MGNDLDPLDDIFADEAVKNTKTVGKFQPKSKFRQQRKDSAKASVSSSPLVQPIDSAPSELSESTKTSKPLEQCTNVVPNDNMDSHAFAEKLVGEKADIFTGSEGLGDFLPPATTDKECTVPPSEVLAVDVPDPENMGGRLGSPVLSSFEDSTPTCKVADVPSDPGLSAEEDPITAGQKTGKFHPKPKLQMQKKICEGNESASYSLGSHSVQHDINYSEKDSVSIFQQDDVLDLSSLGFTHTLPTEATSELLLNEESLNLMEMAQLDSCFQLEGLPEVPAELAFHRAKTGSSKTHAASDPSPQQQKASASSQDNETGRSLRTRVDKTNSCQLVNEDRDEVLATGEISEKCPLSSAVEEENINNEEFQVETEAQKKRLKRKPRKTDDGKEKPARKRKKAKEASDQDIGAKQKKFSHSTRRRRVDKTLLETPEEEFDPSQVPLRDLILLAEYKERQMKKELAATGAPPTNQSTGNSSGLYDGENFTSEQGREYDEQQRNPTGEDTTECFNYHSHMDRTPRARWSKQETELFYEAVRQFGTDFSLIQLRFPGLSRQQVKLKYKKEERQQPLRLREALTNRSTDLSHYEKVLEHVRQMVAEENQNADKDDSVDLTVNGEADEGTSNADDVEVKDEQAEQEATDNIASDFNEVQSPLKPDDDEEDDFFRWSQYKSDI